MKAKLAHIQSGITKWYLKEIAPMGWKAMFATPLVNLGVANIIKKNINLIDLISDEDGCIDIELLHKDYAEIVNKSGTVELFGIKFNIQDLDSLYETIKAEIPANTQSA